MKARVPISPAASASVAVVITTYNDAAYLRDALDSVAAQTRPADEVIVVDDGSRRDPSRRLRRYPFARLIRRENGGLSAARNSGLQSTDCDFVIFLDADDRLRPEAIAAGLAAFERCPEAAFVYGAHRLVNARLRVIAKDRISAVGDNPFRDLLTGNLVAMHATVMYRRDILSKVGGYDESLRCCEDYEIYLRIARKYKICWHSDTIAEYRKHNSNMSKNIPKMLNTVLSILERYSDLDEDDRRARYEGERNWRDHYNSLLPIHNHSILFYLADYWRKILKKERSTSAD